MPDNSPRYRSWRFGRTTLAVAAALTVSMFGWQAYHLYESQKAAAERDSGECPTRAVEAAYSAGERLDYLTEEIEHSLLLWGAAAADSPIPELAARFNATSAELDGALNRALALSKGEVLLAVEQLEAAHAPLDQHVGGVLSLVAASESDLAPTELTGSRFIGLRTDYAVALDGMWTASRQHLVKQLEKERQAEVLSVGVALGLFALAVGAWGLFLRQIRRGQSRLHKEEAQRLRAEEDLLQAQKMDALGTMAGGIAHDFNNLVTAIWGSAASARAHLSPNHPSMASIERIEHASEQANEVLHALLTFSRRADSIKAPVEVGTLIDSTVRLLEPMLPASIDLVVDQPDDPMLWVSGDATQLQQVLMNLTLNAHEAMPAGGRVLVRSWSCTEPIGRTGPRVVIEVKDSGEGIPPEAMDRIFEPFFTTRAPGHGTGLGLSVIHGIVTDHDGRIRVESSPGVETSFLIDLPLIEAPVEPVAQASDPTVLSHHQNGLILVVEDHQHVREIIAESLEATGFRVLQTGCGKEFLEAYENAGGSIDLLIADIDIPPPSGIECIRRLRSRGVTVPAIVITGTPAPGLEDSLDDLSQVIRKPFTMVELAEAASKLVEGAPV
jgi:signal transduction histidine kinase/CheY-like chemotaxis protein